MKYVDIGYLRIGLGYYGIYQQGIMVCAFLDGKNIFINHKNGKITMDITGLPSTSNLCYNITKCENSRMFVMVLYWKGSWNPLLKTYSIKSKESNHWI